MYRDQTTMESSNLGTMYIFWGENFVFGHFSKIRKLNNPTILVMS